MYLTTINGSVFFLKKFVSNIAQLIVSYILSYKLSCSKTSNRIDLKLIQQSFHIL